MGEQRSFKGVINIFGQPFFADIDKRRQLMTEPPEIFFSGRWSMASVGSFFYQSCYSQCKSAGSLCSTHERFDNLIATDIGADR